MTGEIQTPRPDGTRLAARWTALLLGIITALVFWPSLKDGFLYFDDNAYVVFNGHVNDGLNWKNFFWAFQSRETANWHPLTWLSHMADVQVYGLRPEGHHLTNILLHAVNVMLVFVVFRRLTGATWRSLAVAALFGFHPLRVQSVAWISERKDVLSTMFWLLAMWTYTTYAQTIRTAPAIARRNYVLTLLFFLLGLMSKTMLVTLPFVFLLLDFWPLERWRPEDKWKLVREKIPFFILMVIVSYLEYSAQAYAGATHEISLSLPDRIANAVVSYPRYLGKFFWPENLCIYYPHPGHWPAAVVFLSATLMIAISALAWAQRHKMPFLFVGWCWFVGTFVPVINLVQLGSQSIADRYTYVPTIGLSLLLVWGGHAFFVRDRLRAAVAIASGLVILAACIGLTRHEIRFWQGNVAVWTRAVAVTKNNYVAHDRLGQTLASQPTAAIPEFQEAIRINPDYAVAHKDLADQYYKIGRFAEAIPHYQKSLELQPDDAGACYNLGLALFQAGDITAATTAFERATRLQPDFADAHYNLGLGYQQAGRANDAIAAYQKAVALQPDASTYNNLGALLLGTGRRDEAIKDFQAALNLAPDDAGIKKNLALALAQTNQPGPPK